ncbi:MAG: glycosyl hydrolase 115 family protein [Acidobacteriia bacterium]|nr:glycosyl hydrolase 115 family protein [Terriglobia bacterium]
MNRTSSFLAGIFLFSSHLFALGQPRYVETVARPGSFAVAQGKTAATLWVDAADWPGVVRAVSDLQADIERVTGVKPAISNQAPGGNAIIIGTVGKSPIIDRLVQAKKIDVAPVQGKWDSFFVQVVAQPLPGIASALVIAGSNKRGTIYGVYDLSEQMGVSPWYWWADVPVPHKNAVFAKAGKYVQGEPAVKYRGIFLNDESPALSGWVQSKYGMTSIQGVVNMGHEFYARVFELILRLKGNYLWPAMWNNAFNEDDPLNAKLADEYGIVMGTSHHEPMIRAQKEWTRHGKGPWNYLTNEAVLRQFWEDGIRRNKDLESIVTIGMRGDGDMPMAGANDMPANIKLLERIVADQRQMLAGYPSLKEAPQMWALYKEVQDYYDRGMRVPDDVTLLWCDDNWGDIRRLPTEEERKRKGGAGIYYHFDYVGGPRNYKWLNTNPIPKIWEQMNLALQYDAKRIWIVNVGDLKPMEFPIEFFLNYAWDPQRWSYDKLGEFTRMWAEREFGPAHAAEIADLMAKYGKYSARRKPELLDSANFSLVDYQEAERVSTEWKAITGKAEALSKVLPENQKDAFFQLILFPIKAVDQVNEIYIAAARNKLYAAQGRASANDMAARVKGLFLADAEWSKVYNEQLANGKWSHMMDQTHIGYTMWQQPNRNFMPRITEIELPAEAKMGVAVEGSASAWPGAAGDPALPKFDSFNRSKRYIDVFNKGKAPFEFSAEAGAPWIVLSEAKGTVEREQRLWVSVDWAKAPAGAGAGAVKIAGAGGPVTVKVESFNPREVTRATLDGFVEADGVVSIEAAHYAKNTAAGAARWVEIPDIGRTLSGMTILPVTAKSVTPPAASPSLEYHMYLFSTGSVEVNSILSPSLNFDPARGVRLAVSFDAEAPQVVDAIPLNYRAGDRNRDWEESVKNSARTVKTTHKVDQPGYHTLKIWMVDPGVVLQKIVVNTGGMKPSYLGPPESYRRSTAGARVVAPVH